MSNTPKLIVTAAVTAAIDLAIKAACALLIAATVAQHAPFLLTLACLYVVPFATRRG